MAPSEHFDTELEHSLERLAEGNVEEFRPLLRLLSSETLLVPVNSVGPAEDDVEKVTVSAATLIYDGRRTVPVFTSQDYFESWSNDRYDSVEIVGADIAIALPRNVHVVINPGLSHSIELSPPELTELVLVANHSEDSGFSEGVREPSAKLTVLRDLEALLVKYPAVEEGYYLETLSDDAQGVLGLLSTSLTIEQRFFLVTEIAGIARAHFGSAAAIEVYDDLDNPHSSSWDLFNTIAPFYQRDEATLATVEEEETDFEAPAFDFDSLDDSDGEDREVLFDDDEDESWEEALPDASETSPADSEEHSPLPLRSRIVRLNKRDEESTEVANTSPASAERSDASVGKKTSLLSSLFSSTKR